MWSIPPHPLGISPSGNSMFDDFQGSRALSLGALSALPDDLLVDILSLLRCPLSLLRFGACSQWCHAFSRHEPLWKDLALRAARRSLLVFSRSWFLSVTRSPFPPLSLPLVCSDELFAPWHARALPLLPAWTSPRGNVPRVAAASLSQGEFQRRFEAPNLPVVVTGVASAWPAAERWTRERLTLTHGDTGFTCGASEMRLRDYLAYAEGNSDDVPFYLFDKRFGEKAPALLADYATPPFLDSPDHDLFALLPERLRPAFRWLVVGPARSGSRFHQDPNGTSAWNAVVRGHKKWVMFPPHVTPPGVFPSADGSAVTSPLSLVEWFRGYYAEARATGEMRECVVGEGEVVFVPSRWWHIVLNLDWTVAITHNFVSPHNLRAVLRFLEHQPESVSGMLCDEVGKGGFFELFRDVLERERPHLLQKVREQIEAEQRDKLYSFSSAWHDVINDPDAENFSLILLFMN